MELQKYICDKCGKEMTKSELCITLIEHSYNHEHHYCSFSCLGNMAKGYACEYPEKNKEDKK